MKGTSGKPPAKIEGKKGERKGGKEKGRKLTKGKKIYNLQRNIKMDSWLGIISRKARNDAITSLE
jgi:hypothetical protein